MITSLPELKVNAVITPTRINTHQYKNLILSIYNISNYIIYDWYLNIYINSNLLFLNPTGQYNRERAYYYNNYDIFDPVSINIDLPSNRNIIYKYSSKEYHESIPLNPIVLTGIKVKYDLNDIQPEEIIKYNYVTQNGVGGDEILFGNIQNFNV